MKPTFDNLKPSAPRQMCVTELQALQERSLASGSKLEMPVLNAPARACKSHGIKLSSSSLQEDEEDDETETPHSLAGGGIPHAPLQHYRSSRGFGEGSEVALGRSPLRPTTSNAAVSMALDGENGDLAKSARVKVTGRALRSHTESDLLPSMMAILCQTSGVNCRGTWAQHGAPDHCVDLAGLFTDCPVSWGRRAALSGTSCFGMACKLLYHVAPMQAANEAELAAIRSRIEAALGVGVTEKRIADLLSLAQFQMLSRDTRVVRSPTVVLSMRPQRSTTLRYSTASFLHFARQRHLWSLLVFVDTCWSFL